MGYVEEHTQQNPEGSYSLITPDGKYETYRFTAFGGGYFVERFLGRGVYAPVPYKLTKSGLNAEDVPDAVWDHREEYAEDQIAAFKAIREGGQDPNLPTADIDSPERPVRQAVASLEQMGYLLWWPPEYAEQYVRDYIEQWEAGGAGGPEHQGEPQPGDTSVEEVPVE